MKSDKVLHLSRSQYREFADISNSFGMALNLSTYTSLEGWGTYSPWALLTYKDVREEDPKGEEHALITLATTVSTARYRAAGRNRPELNWAALEDHEIYPFIFWHEIGHRVDNFSMIEIMIIKDLDVRDECHRRSRCINEVLADRFAWAKIRPGEPVPLNPNSLAIREEMLKAMAYMERHAIKQPTCKYPLSSDQYCDVPDYMLATPERAAFVGPEVNKKLLQSRVEYHRNYFESNGRSLY